MEDVENFDRAGYNVDRYADKSFFHRHKVQLISVLLGLVCIAFLIVAIVVFKRRDNPSSGASFDSTIASLWTNEKELKTTRMNVMNGMDPSKIKEFTELFSAEPHIAASERNTWLADVAYQNFKAFGFDDVRLEKIPVLLENLKYRSVNSTDEGGAVKYRCKLEELNVVNETNWSKALPPSNGYSGEGWAKGKLVWANYGREEDFEALGAMNLTGTIVAVRYGQIYRGNKVKLAQSRGAAGVIIVEDPADMQKGVSFPNGPWASNYTVQRGSVYTGEGDPLTPSWASNFDGPTLQGTDLFDESKMDGNALPEIPVQPMAIVDAVEILKNLGGVKLPDGWNNSQYATWGYFTAGIGPGPQIIEMEVRRDLVVKTATNVIATIFGAQEPDRTVTIGSHRDAWTYGAVDPISGHSTVHEIARNIGKLHKNGWKPRRTIEVCSWDAEEYAIIGSIEYVEGHLEQLRARAVAHLNLDTAINGIQRLGVEGSPSFKSLLKEAAAEVELPNGRGKLDSVMDELTAIGSGSDHIGFIQLAGVPSIETNFYNNSEVYESVYHSNYDSSYWIENFGDPGYLYHATMAKFYANLLLRLSDSNIIPLSIVDYADAVQRWTNDYVKENYTFANFSFLQNAVTSFVKAAAVHDTRVKRAEAMLSGTSEMQNQLSPFELRAVNDIQMGLERVFLAFGKAETGQSWYKHVLFTPSAVDSYGHTIMPIIANALLTGNTTQANFAIGRIGQFVRSAANYVNSSYVFPS